jgi:beta-galactosidase/beta-glucuronidase
MTINNIRNDYPRPQFVRSDWCSLNGEWEFAYDDDQLGDREGWHTGKSFPLRIQVPFCYQSSLSGIGNKEMHDRVWYRRNFAVPANFAQKRVLLHFGAVDYQCWIWINGQFVKFHEGGHTPFSIDITDVLREENNELVLKVQDFSLDVTLPRGKQYWKEQSELIFYTRTTGIWQSVWMEAVSETYIGKVKYVPNIDTNEIQIRFFLENFNSNGDIRVKVAISSAGKLISEDEYRIFHAEEFRTISLHDFNDHGLGRWWSPERPHLYDVEYILYKNGNEVDRVISYFGMRKISVENGTVCLNNRPYYMKTVLDQGYFPDGLLTAPSDDALRHDVELTKAMGFNGARKHQKIEDPRYLYWCDRLGLLVWGEMANAYDYSQDYVRKITVEWQEAINRDFNHPCIVVWVPINESWGVPNILVDEQQQAHALALYYLTKSLDPTRLVVSNDGWEHMKSDLCTIHDYEWRSGVLDLRYGSAENAVMMPQKREMYVGGFSYQGEPILLSEFGGVSFQKGEHHGWGYSSAVDEVDYTKRVSVIFRSVLKSPVIQGYCYTQLTDVEQEINGLLTADRQPKIPIEQIKQINEGKNPSD